MSTFEEIVRIFEFFEIDINLFLQDIAKYNNGKELSELNREYLCLMILDETPTNIAWQKYESYAYQQCQIENAHSVEEQIQACVESFIKKKADNIRGTLCDYITPCVRGLIENTDTSFLSRKRKGEKTKSVHWGKVFKFLLKYYRINRGAIQSLPSFSSKIEIHFNDNDSVKFQAISNLLQLFIEIVGEGSIKFGKYEQEDNNEEEE